MRPLSRSNYLLITIFLVLGLGCFLFLSLIYWLCATISEYSIHYWRGVGKPLALENWIENFLHEWCWHEQWELNKYNKSYFEFRKTLDDRRLVTATANGWTTHTHREQGNNFRFLCISCAFWFIFKMNSPGVYDQRWTAISILFRYWFNFAMQDFANEERWVFFMYFVWGTIRWYKRSNRKIWGGVEKCGRNREIADRPDARLNSSERRIEIAR